MAGTVRILFLHVAAPRMSIFHIPPGLVAVMDLVSRMRGSEISVKSLQWDDINTEVLAEEIRTARAQIVAFPVFSDGHERVQHVIRRLRQKRVTAAFVIGGPHVEAVGDSFLGDVRGVFRCTEPSGIQIHNAFARAIESVNGVCYSPPDSMPGSSHLGLGPIRYEILERLNAPAWKRFRPVIITSLGCDRRCLFCAEGCRDEGLRFRPYDAVREELQWTSSNTEFPYAMIADDNVLASEEHAGRMVDILSETLHSNPDLHVFMLMRPDDVVAKRAVAHALSAQHLLRVQLGIESGSQTMRQRYGKKFSNEVVRQAVKFLYEFGIPFIVGSFILGGPYEDESSLNQTETLIHELIDIAPGVFEPTFGFLRPYPGTRIMTSFGKGLRPIPGIRVGNTIEDRPLLQTPAMNEEKLLEARDRLFSSIRNHMVSICDQITAVSWVRKYAYERRFQFESLWTEFFKEAPNCGAILDMSARRERVDIEAISCDEALMCRPRCAVQVPPYAYSRGTSLPFGRGRVMDISAETARLLMLCNGERTLRDVVEDFNVTRACDAKVDSQTVWNTLRQLTKGFLCVWDAS